MQWHLKNPLFERNGDLTRLVMETSRLSKDQRFYRTSPMNQASQRVYPSRAIRGAATLPDIVNTKGGRHRVGCLW